MKSSVSFHLVSISDSFRWDPAIIVTFTAEILEAKYNYYMTDVTFSKVNKFFFTDLRNLSWHSIQADV